MVNKQDIENWFTYHDDPNKVPKYKAIREAAKYLASVIVDNTPFGLDQEAAVRKLREAVMTANAAIACDNSYAVQGLVNSAGLGEALGPKAYGKAADISREYVEILERRLKDAQDQLLGPGVPRRV